jgi:hypothetical protein
MIRVIKVDIELVAEDSGSIDERNPMLLKIGLGLGFILLKIHQRSIASRAQAADNERYLTLRFSGQPTTALEETCR